MARGEPIWQTSSTGPTSMPSSREAVATRARRSPGPQPLLDDATAGRREAPVVGGHLERGVDLAARGGDGALLGAEPEGQLVGHPLGHLPGVDEDQRGAVLEHVPGDPVEDVGELRTAGHRLELAVGQLDGHVEVAGVPAVDDGRRGAVGIDAGEQAGHHLERALGGRQPDALQPAAPLGDQVGEPLQAEGEVGARACPGPGCGPRRR